MATNTFNVRFVVKLEKIDKEGQCPVYAKVKVNGNKIELATARKIASKDWNSEKGLSRTSNELNEFLEAFKSRIYSAYTKLMLRDEPIIAQNLKEQISGKKEESEPVYLLIETITEHNNHFKQMVGIKYSPGTYKGYKTTLKFLQEFVLLFSRKKDLPLSEVNYKFCEAFFTFLTTVKTCKQNGANKQIQRLKRIINYSINQGYLKTNPMASFSLVFDTVVKKALTMDEVNKIAGLELHNATLSRVRDVFLLQCFTGLSYTDIKELSLRHIQQDAEGTTWIRMQRQKTQISFSLPLLPPAIELLEKYLPMVKDDEPIMPVLSNQKMNQHLKLIQELAGVKQTLTTHIARHTFATAITLANGVPMETVSKMLGHTKMSTTQLYAKVLEGKIKEDMSGLKKLFTKPDTSVAEEANQLCSYKTGSSFNHLPQIKYYEGRLLLAA